LVVLLPPRGNLPPRIEQVLKPAHIQTLFPQSSVKALHVRILGWLPWLNMYQLKHELEADLTLSSVVSALPAVVTLLAQRAGVSRASAGGLWAGSDFEVFWREKRRLPEGRRQTTNTALRLTAQEPGQSRRPVR